MIRFLDRQARFIFPGPAILALIILYAAPISYTLYLSLYRWDLSPIHPPVPVGLANYAQLLGDHRFFRAILNTLYYCALALPAQLVIGIAIALLLNRKFHGRGVTLAIFLFPTMATPIASLIGWRMLLAPDVGLFG